MMNKGDDLQEKKLRGSGGYVYAKVTEEEQRRGNLGGPELFLAGVGRLDEARFSKYYCSKCEREYKGSPTINYENPNEQLGEGVTLIEIGAYKCGTCNSILAQYRKFERPSPNTISTTVENNNALPKAQSPDVHHNDEASVDSLSQQSKAADVNASSVVNNHTLPNNASSITKATPLTTQQGFVPIQSLVGMPAYDSEAVLVGRVKEIGLRRSLEGQVQITVKISKKDNDNIMESSFNQTDEVMWSDISKIGDVVLLAATAKKKERTTNDNQQLSNKRKCTSCGYQNEMDAIFCEECGNKLI